MSAFICSGNEGIENKLPALNRTAHSKHKYLLLLNFIVTCLLGATTDESSKPFFHFTFYTHHGLEDMGFQHQRTGELGDHTLVP